MPAMDQLNLSHDPSTWPRSVIYKHHVIVQASGLVPIVEPEVLLDGEHDIDATLEVAEAIWAETFKYMADNKVRWHFGISSGQ